MNETAEARASGYIHCTIRTETGQHNAHIFELGRQSALVSLAEVLPYGTGVAIDIDVDDTFEQMTGAPDIVSLLGHVVDSTIDEGPIHGEHHEIEFTGESIEYWGELTPWLVRAYRMRTPPPTAGAAQ